MSEDSVLPRAPLRPCWKQQHTLGILFAVSLATSSLRAAGETASTRVDTSSPLFAEGLRALDARQYVRARQSFERLYRNRATPDALFQLGRIAQAEGKDVLAADLFRRYRELVGGLLDPANKAVIDSHLAALKQPATEVRIVALEWYRPGETDTGASAQQVQHHRSTTAPTDSTNILRSASRLAFGGILIGGGIFTAVLGASALSVNGSCAEAIPTVDGAPCPMTYSTNGVGGGLLRGELALTTAGVVLMELPGRKLNRQDASNLLKAETSSFSID